MVIKKKTTLAIIAGILLIVPFTSSAQDSISDPEHEIGGRVSGGLDASIGFVYKHKVKENSYFRLTAGTIFFNGALNSNITAINGLSYGFNLSLGNEWRKDIVNKLQFIHGFAPSVSYSAVSTLSPNPPSHSTHNVGVNLGYALGFQYNFNSNFSIALETIPALYSNFMFSSNPSVVESNDFGFRFDTYAALTLVYRFNRKK